MINLNKKKFIPFVNAENGEVDQNTVFEYSQEDDIISARYKGGNIKYGHLIGKITGPFSFSIRYHHVNCKGDLMTGTCNTLVNFDENGKMILDESWQWTCGDFSEGTSRLIEF